MRRVGYGASGVIVGIIIYILLLTGMPSPVIVKSSLADFPQEEKSNESEYISEEDYYQGGSIVPFLEYGSYHLTAGDITGYENAGIIKYGKLNPMFYFEREPEPIPEDESEGSEEITVSGSDNKESTTDDKDVDLFAGHKVTDGRGGKLTKDLQLGFNIHTRSEEERDIFAMKKEFANNGSFPIDRSFYNISSTFGRRVDPIENIDAYHVGLDIASENINGQNIYSVLPGEVVATGLDKSGYGHYIIIKHGEFETLYAHMNAESPLTIGDKVNSGDKVGNIGNSGRSTGPHLHLEVGIGGLKLDPEIFLAEIGKGE